MLSIILSIAIGLAVGWFGREVREYLKRIEQALKILIQRKDKVEAQEIAQKKGMSFGSPMTMSELAEMEEEERIAAVNATMQ